MSCLSCPGSAGLFELGLVIRMSCLSCPGSAGRFEAWISPQPTLEHRGLLLSITKVEGLALGWGRLFSFVNVKNKEKHSPKGGRDKGNESGPNREPLWLQGLKYKCLGV